MKYATWIFAALSLAACGSGSSDVSTFACPNGPNLGVVYSGDTVTIAFPDGRSETLPKSSEAIYAKPGMVWQITAFRTARLTDGSTSFHCDQSSI